MHSFRYVTRSLLPFICTEAVLSSLPHPRPPRYLWLQTPQSFGQNHARRRCLMRTRQWRCWLEANYPSEMVNDRGVSQPYGISRGGPWTVVRLQ
ncbi:hypothetical protein J6590_076035 [Homalodisca vitripennis]|nr:hypothetical protein J6590_076035 [Homalodisca vitripennis]